jgi:hypothetical protein
MDFGFAAFAAPRNDGFLKLLGRRDVDEAQLCALGAVPLVDA